MRSPVGSRSDPAPLPPLPSRMRPSIWNDAGAEPVVLDELDVDRPHERVALVAGVLPGRLAQLALEAVVDLAEPLVVLGAEVHGEGVGHDRAAADVDRAVVVHLPHQPPAELDRTQPGAEQARERRPRPSAPTVARSPSAPRPGRIPAGAAATVAWTRRSADSRWEPAPASALESSSYSGEWRNWQTRRIQVPVG